MIVPASIDTHAHLRAPGQPCSAREPRRQTRVGSAADLLARKPASTRNTRQPPRPLAILTNKVLIVSL